MSVPVQQQHWWQQPAARSLVAAEKLYVQNFMSELKGHSLICCSNIIDDKLIQAYHWSNYWYYQHEIGSVGESRSIIGEYHELPFLSESIDNFIVPHVLDFNPRARMVIKELWRSLAPEGKVLITGFNNNSLFGLPGFLPRQTRQRLNKAEVIRHYLSNEGFAIEAAKTFYFRPRRLHNKNNAVARFTEVLGNLFWPAMGCFYVFLARKPVLAVSVNARKQKARKIMIPRAVAKPT